MRRPVILMVVVEEVVMVVGMVGVEMVVDVVASCTRLRKLPLTGAVSRQCPLSSALSLSPSGRAC